MSRPSTTSSDLRERWQVLQLLGPVFELLERAAPRAGFDHRAYDLAQLALRAIDHVVRNQASLDGSVSPAAVVDHLTQVARRMHPVDELRPWTKVARAVFASLLNDGRPHEATWIEPGPDDGGEPVAVPFRFRLLRLVESDDGTAITATDQAIVLYLQALATDLADRALALKLMVGIQMRSGEFEKALASAAEATRTAEGLAASLRHKLDDTRRDVRSVDWTAEMPTWLADTLSRIGEQLDHDRQLMTLAEQSGADPDARATCLRITTEVRNGQDVWLRLERFVQQAIPVFLAAQQVQRFRPRGLAAVVDLARDLLGPVLGSSDPVLAATGDGLLGAVAPAAPPPCWGVDELCAVLLRPPLLREQPAPHLDDPGELAADIAADSVPADVAAVVADLLDDAARTPTRASEMLTAARARAVEVEDPQRLLDVLWGASLWAFVSGAEAVQDELPRRANLATALAPLVAVDDGKTLADERFAGPDLLVATGPALDLIDHLEEPAT